MTRDHAEIAVTPRRGTPPSRGERLRVPWLDPVQRPTVHDQPGTVRLSREPVRSVRAAAPAGCPEQPHRLRRECCDLLVEVQQHRVIPFQPGLVPDVPAECGRPPQSRIVALALPRRERPHRAAALERNRRRVAQVYAVFTTVPVDVCHLEPSAGEGTPPVTDLRTAPIPPRWQATNHLARHLRQIHRDERFMVRQFSQEDLAASVQVAVRGACSFTRPSHTPTQNPSPHPKVTLYARWSACRPWSPSA